MPICLVLHEPGLGAPDAEHAFFDAVFEVASSHWRVAPGATLLGTDLSPGYIRDHLRRALEGAGNARAGLLLVTPLPSAAAWHGLPPEGEAWIAGEEN